MIIILLLLLITLLLVVVSFNKVRNDKDKLSFIYRWGFLVGAFVWEDLFLISLFFSFSLMLVLLVSDIRVGLLIFNVFWIVRSGGEVLYFFLQQFFEPKHHPHSIDEHFILVRRIFGDISTQKCFIIMQVLLQLSLVVFICLLILLLSQWNSFPKWL
jgi:hypothetical protein